MTEVEQNIENACDISVNNWLRDNIDKVNHKLEDHDKYDRISMIQDLITDCAADATEEVKNAMEKLLSEWWEVACEQIIRSAMEAGHLSKSEANKMIEEIKTYAPAKFDVN